MLLGVGLVIVLAIASRHLNLHTMLQAALSWVASLGVKGVIAFVLVYNIATVLLLPGSLLTLGGGALYGVVWGSVYVMIAATLGAIVAFVIGRYFARDWVSRQLQNHPKFQAIDRAVAQGGWRIVLLTRLSPLFPFNLLNYLFGVTCISLKDYVLGSIGMFPSSVMYVYIGALAGDLAALDGPATQQAQAAWWLLNAVGCLATVAATLHITRIAKTALNQSVAQNVASLSRHDSPD